MNTGLVLGFTLLCCVSFTSANFVEDVHGQLVGRVIHFESLQFQGRGYWLAQNPQTDADGSFHVSFDPVNERDTYTTAKVQFMVSECEGPDIVPYLCFESLAKRGYYLTAGYLAKTDQETVKLQRSTYANGDRRFHWSVLCETTSMETCRIVSRRFAVEAPNNVDNWFIARGGNNIGSMAANSLLGEGEFRIHAPNPTDGMEVIYTNTNTGNVDQKATYSTTVGIEKSSSSSSDLTASASIEIGASFKIFSASASASISNTWSKSTSETFSKSTTVSHEITIPKRSKVELKQLRGYYAGQFTIGEDVYLFEVTSLDTGKTEVKEMKF